MLTIYGPEAPKNRDFRKEVIENRSYNFVPQTPKTYDLGP
jgi:hypothetical protein